MRAAAVLNLLSFRFFFIIILYICKSLFFDYWVKKKWKLKGCGWVWLEGDGRIWVVLVGGKGIDVWIPDDERIREMCLFGGVNGTVWFNIIEIRSIE